jgi:hypothetical protein
VRIVRLASFEQIGEPLTPTEVGLFRLPQPSDYFGYEERLFGSAGTHDVNVCEGGRDITPQLREPPHGQRGSVQV